jgi:hypothetical protein
VAFPLLLSACVICRVNSPAAAALSIRENSLHYYALSKPGKWVNNFLLCESIAPQGRGVKGEPRGVSTDWSRMPNVYIRYPTSVIYPTRLIFPDRMPIIFASSSLNAVCSHYKPHDRQRPDRPPPDVLMRPYGPKNQKYGHFRGRAEPYPAPNITGVDHVTFHRTM